MNNKFTHFILTALICLSFSGVWAQGLEDFTNFPETSNSYHDGTFVGMDGSTWNYYQCRGDSVITAPTPTLGKNRTPTAEITSGLLANGMGTLSFDYEQVFSSNVSLDVKVNGTLITTVTTNSEQGIVKNTGPIVVNVSGSVTLTLIQTNTNAGQVSVDNITWTAYGSSTPDPEPSNYPTSFAVTGEGLSLHASWTDATGAQLPAAYLLKISSTDNITAPVDGTFTGDDLNLSDGAGAKNVMQGVQEYTFDGLNATSTYYLKIYPYTNAGSTVDYKTDGTAPSGSARTQAILHQQNFDLGLSPWTEFSVTGDEKWTTDTISNVIFAKMSGYSGGAGHANEDWLVSPTLSIPAGSSPNLAFVSAMNYGTGTSGIQLMVSTDYSSGDPSTNGTWTDLTSSATFSAGSWTWTPSGLVSVTGYEGTNVHIAFKYTCETTAVPTWEIDDVTLTNNSGVGIHEGTPATSTSLYPNPCTSEFRVDIPSGNTFTLVLFNSQGAKVLERVINRTGTAVSTSGIGAGMYLAEIRDASGQIREMHKLIIR